MLLGKSVPYHRLEWVEEEGQRFSHDPSLEYAVDINSIGERLSLHIPELL